VIDAEGRRPGHRDGRPVAQWKPRSRKEVLREDKVEGRRRESESITIDERQHVATTLPSISRAKVTTHGGKRRFRPAMPPRADLDMATPSTGTVARA